MLPSMLSYYEHLTKMGLRLGMAFESVLVTTLLFADLAVPSEPLKTL
jgi:hypothetical protein